MIYVCYIVFNIFIYKYVCMTPIKTMCISKGYKYEKSMNLNILKCVKASHVCSQNNWPVGMFKPKQYGKGKKVKTCPEYGKLPQGPKATFGTLS